MKKKMLFVITTLVAFVLFVPNARATEVSEPKVYTSGENILELEDEFQASGYDAAIYVHSGAKLTINGDGSVHAYADNNGSGVKYSTTVWANGKGSEIIINGGTYTNEGVEGDDHFDLVYAKDGGKIIINGGTFKCATPKWTLNLHDSKLGEIVVKGGTFYKFNPAEAETEPGEGTYNFVAPGYGVIKEGDWYTVIKTEYSSGNNTLELSKDILASGYDAAIYVHSGAKLTINGDGKVHAFADNAGSGVKYSTTVWANGQGSEIIINGGTYTNQGVEGDDHFDLVYAKDGGKVIINGGTFKCVTPKWTLNLHDSKLGEIVVKGGTFYKFNPAEAETEPGEGTYNFVAQGYRVVQEGDWYTVYEIKETQAEVSNNVDNALQAEEIVLDSLKNAIEDDSELAEAVEGKSIEVEVQVRPIEITESEKETIEKETAKINKTIKIVDYIDISIIVKDADTDDEITKLSTVKETLKFTLEIPSELKKDIPEGYSRIFYVVRNHNGVVDVLETKEDDGILSFESDKFSTYALAYEDKIVEDKNDNSAEASKEENPKTGDVNLIFLIGTVLVGAAGAVIISKKRFAKSN